MARSQIRATGRYLLSVKEHEMLRCSVAVSCYTLKEKRPLSGISANRENQAKTIFFRESGNDISGDTGT